MADAAARETTEKLANNPEIRRVKASAPQNSVHSEDSFTSAAVSIIVVFLYCQKLGIRIYYYFVAG